MINIEVEQMNELHIYPIMVPTDTGRLQSINFYLVKSKDKVILIDAGVNNQQCWDALNAMLKKHALTIYDINAVLLTHNHSDHTGLVNPILALNNVPIYSHKDAIIRLKRDKIFLEKRVLFYENLYKKMGCGSEANQQIERMKHAIDKNAHQKVSSEIIPLQEGDTLFGFKIYEIPGHAPDHIAFWHEDSKSMFVGDHILKNSPTNALVECDQFGHRLPTLIQYEQSLQKLNTFEIAIAYPGHGEVIEHTHSLINGKLERIKKKGERIKQLLTESKRASQIAHEMYGKRYDTLIALVMSEIIGHLDRLESLNEVTSEKINGIYYFSAI